MDREMNEAMALLRKESMWMRAVVASTVLVEFAFFLAYGFLLLPRVDLSGYPGILTGMRGAIGLSYTSYLIRAAWGVDQQVEALGKLNENEFTAGLDALRQAEIASREMSDRGLRKRIISNLLIVVVEFVYAGTAYTVAALLLLFIIHQIGNLGQRRFRRKLGEVAPVWD